MPRGTEARIAVPADSSGADGRARAAGPRWLRLGFVALLGAVAGATLFATEAQGRAETRRRSEDEQT